MLGFEGVGGGCGIGTAESDVCCAWNVWGDDPRGWCSWMNEGEVLGCEGTH